jgi:hypothetical protein
MLLIVNLKVAGSRFLKGFAISKDLFENRILTKIFGSKREEGAKG